MTYTATRLFIVITAIIGLTAVPTFAQRSNLTRGQWKLTEAYNRAVTRSAAFIDIEEGLTKFNGNTGCNGMVGTMSVRGRSIHLSSVATTKRYCKLMGGNVVEGTFLKALNDTATFAANARTLRLYDRRGRQILTFTRVADASGEATAALGDRKWVLEQIKNRQTFAALPYAFVNFDESKGSAGGNSGCNVFGGSYTAKGSSIRITDVIGTMRACEEDNKMAVEREMFDGLRNADRYEIRDDRLYLYRRSELLLTFRGEKK